MKFISTELTGFSDIINAIMQDALKITDAEFRSDCYEIMKKWVMQKQTEVKNSAISPYRESLKKCETAFLVCLIELLLH